MNGALMKEPKAVKLDDNELKVLVDFLINQDVEELQNDEKAGELQTLYSPLKIKLWLNMCKQFGIKVQKKDQAIEGELVDCDPELSQDNNTILLVNRMLLRVLSTLQGIDHTLAFYANENLKYKDFYTEQRKILKDLYVELLETKNLLELHEGNIKKLEKKYSAKLFQVLYDCALTSGINTNMASLLLVHYRHWASLLEPAPTLMLSCVIDGNRYISTVKPITKKSKVQKEALAKMESSDQESAPENFHTAHANAFQKANRAFCTRACEDDSLLHPKFRERVQPGLRNAFNNTLEIITKDGQRFIQTSLRCGSIVYVGKGNTENLEATKANLQQLHAANDEKPIHLIALTTGSSSINHENEMAQGTRQAINDLGSKDYRCTNIPVSELGRIFTPQYDSSIEEESKLSSFEGRTQRKVSHAIDIASGIERVGNATVVIMCASGSNRTGVVEARRTLRYIEEKVQRPTEEMLERFVALSNALIPSLTDPGIVGCKHEANPGHFSSRIERLLFSQDAEKSKQQKANINDIKKTLKHGRAIDYECAKQKLRELQNSSNSQQIAQNIKQLIQHTDLIKDKHEVLSGLSNLLEAAHHLITTTDEELYSTTTMNEYRKLSDSFENKWPTLHRLWDKFLQQISYINERKCEQRANIRLRKHDVFNSSVVFFRTNLGLIGYAARLKAFFATHPKIAAGAVLIGAILIAGGIVAALGPVGIIPAVMIMGKALAIATAAVGITAGAASGALGVYGLWKYKGSDSSNGNADRDSNLSSSSISSSAASM